VRSGEFKPRPSAGQRAFGAAGRRFGAAHRRRKLNYREEKILETYKVETSTTLTFDYRFFLDPADRGPVPVFAVLLPAEF
jgi:hypothetical protein